jgi:peptide chain release factor subunit 3
MNPNAGEWKPSAAAAEWSPSPRPPPPPPPPPAAAAAAAVPETVDADANMIMNTDDKLAPPSEPDDDDDDPLWRLVLDKICDGDRDRASRLIADPDSLAEYPEVAALIAATSSAAMEVDDGGDDWEEGADDGNKNDNTSGADARVDDLVDAVRNIVVDFKEDTPDVAAAPDDSANAIQAVEGDPREHLNLVFIGHVDAGKSTLSGNILYLTENVDKRTIEKYEQEAKERNRESWFLAFIMDTNEEERAKGKTVEVGRATFETKHHRYSILDAPGHKNYVPNMIMGASQADVGVLVISARKGEFEAGFDKGGQTREHALLAKTLGVSFLVVVINKMDEPTVRWRKERFDECVNKLRPFLKGCGFKIKKEVKFMPISGLNGANVKDEVDPKECGWWANCWKTGENNTSQSTLMGLLDNLEMKGRNPNAPVRMPVLDRYSDRGTIAMGKVESGTIRPGSKIILMPTRQTFKVDGIWSDETPIASARPGENVLVKIGGAGMEDVQKGFVICTDPPCRSVDKIICQIMVMDLPEHAKILTAGFQSVFHAHCAEEEATVTKIFETTDKKGKVHKGAHFAQVGMTVICMIELARTVPCETYDDYPFLGRFTLRTEGKTCAIGIIKKLPPKKE